MLVLGDWARGSVRVGAAMTDVSHRGAGLFRAGAAAWLERLRGEPRLIVAAAVEGGALAVWEGLPSRNFVLAHLESAAEAGGR